MGLETHLPETLTDCTAQQNSGSGFKWWANVQQIAFGRSFFAFPGCPWRAGTIDDSTRRVMIPLPVHSVVVWCGAVLCCVVAHGSSFYFSMLVIALGWGLLMSAGSVEFLGAKNGISTRLRTFGVGRVGFSSHVIFFWTFVSGVLSCDSYGWRWRFGVGQGALLGCILLLNTVCLWGGVCTQEHILTLNWYLGRLE